MMSQAELLVKERKMEIKVAEAALKAAKKSGKADAIAQAEKLVERKKVDNTHTDSRSLSHWLPHAH